MNFKSQRQPNNEMTAISLIDECIEHSENNYQVLPNAVQQRVSSILSALKTNSVHAESPLELGDLIASLAELVPIKAPLFVELCDAISNLCKDREVAQFSDEAIETVSNIVLKHLELRTFDPSPGLRTMSTLLYNNTLRLAKLHERILEAAVSLASVSDESQRRSCVLVGNLNAFSQQTLERTIYTRSTKFLLQFLVSSSAKNGTDLISSALRSLQLLILDAPSDLLDPQVLAQTMAGIAFKANPAALKYEAIMAIKALANTSKQAFYAQWSMLLTKQPSLFDLLKANPRVSKATADLLTDIFRDTWKFLYIADNTSSRPAFTTLAQQIGDVIDITFNRFISSLSISPSAMTSKKNENDKLDPVVFNKVSKALATFIRNCSFDSGRLKAGYIERTIEWAKQTLLATTEESLIVMKSLLWTDIKFEPFHKHFDYLFQTFIFYMNNKNEAFSKPARFALCRMAYAYPEEVVKRYEMLSKKLTEIGPVHSLPIYLRLAEKGVTDMKIWLDLLQIQIPRSFEINHVKSIQRSLQCIGLSGIVFSDLPDNLQRFCLSMVLSNDGAEAAHSVGLLARSSAADISSVFLTDALLRLTSYRPPPLQPLSNVLESFALKHRDIFERKWVNPVVQCLQEAESDSSPYGPRCVGFLFAFIDPNEELATSLMNILLSDLKKMNEPKMRWNAASALSNAFAFGASSEAAVITLAEYLENDRVAKVRIKAAEALANIGSRNAYAGGEKIYHKILIVTLQSLLAPAHFTNLPLQTHRKYNATFREVLVKLFFKLLDWSKASDFTSLEEPLISNVDAIFDLLESHEDAPWKQITRLYEAKFNSIPSKTLEKFQDKAFPV